MPVIGPDQSNLGVPQVFSGPRAMFMVNDRAIAYASDVNGEETVQYEPVDCLDLLEVKEHVPVAYRCSMNAKVFRVIGQSIKKLGIFPKLIDVITSASMNACIVDAKPVEGGSQNVALFTGVRCSGHTWDTNARGLVSENVTFVAIRVQDEHELLG